MELNINWKELGIQILKAIWPVLSGALTGATVVTAPSSRTDSRGFTNSAISALSAVRGFANARRICASA